jgi:tetratricopeptide (TPR) repeat protein
MRHLKKSLLTLLLASSPLLAQMNPHEWLHQAWFFSQQGQFGKTIDMAKPLIDANELSGIELGRAFLILGVAYAGDGKFAEARSAFERSLHILDHDLEHVTDYAAALDNYAALYSNVGQLDIAGQMWQKALRLRQQSGDHTGATRSFTNLAGFALAQNRIREAKRYLKRANVEMKWTHDLIDDDFATLFETEGWLALAEGDPSTAIRKYQQALEICKRTHGEQHWLTGWEYVLRGKAFAQTGNMDRALADMRMGLIVLDHALGNKNPKYFVAQIAYSQILDRTGSHTEAAQIKAAAEQASKAFYSHQCVGCTINVAAFR